MENEKYPGLEVRPEVITYDDVVKAVPRLAGHRRLVGAMMRLLRIDEVNRVHSAWCSTPGPEFARHLIEDEFKTPLVVDGEEILASFSEGAFITVSNHPFGALDGIALIDLVTRYRPEYKVMVNMILGKISAMRPNFIAVDAWQTDDPEKRKVSVNGVRDAMRMLKEGKPVGFFPAGAMSKTDRSGFLVDREWQPTVLQLIGKAKVPVIPIYFHGTNRWLFNFLGHACWPLRSAMLPRELFSKKGKPIHISVGEPVSVEEQAQYGKDYVALGKMLRERTYALHDRYGTAKK
ncbi:MAG: lysophospholipid acyltransferase family protein [Muribaculaceae bacterium]|nr:lysophospholipid acyltransferase family protein [Muribaculaceae bacterium]MDE7081755.1 lysophospholipid acyltransferase family protein [Muribaculaceae bacterium]